ncbi:conserved hypothetical protein [Planctopirus limnophila DSM 3776]|uniref:Bacteriocin-protection protein, YdeI/OmpD-associated family n=1 Tax=Planctopirus limnophila (strain ATCC 43296 / DSM 3776 / IFAM 1008 / Mu 290) TaxID=521674 RepID=D5SUQ0_PLAL2|nr:YdeI/OmpD-associated family protein [Planctopirus limnophila]ADG67102.1 conserved hypothetical protein [Planctopirus limnophila DSM 3776]
MAFSGRSPKASKPALASLESKLEPENSIHCENRNAWRAWLQTHHLASTGVWLITYKKGRHHEWLGYDAIVEEALCFGWIDSLPRKLDETRTMLYVSPRKPKSGWSKVNKERIHRLEQQGLLAPAGMARIQAAKEDGSWDKLTTVDELEVPDDLAEEFARWPGSSANFAAFPPSARRGILEWILNAKRPQTRHARIVETASQAARNERANQWKPKSSPGANS